MKFKDLLENDLNKLGDVKIVDYFGQSFLFMEKEKCNEQELDLLKNIVFQKWEVIYIENIDLDIEDFCYYFENNNSIGGKILDVFGKENILIHEQGNTKIIVLNKKVTTKQFEKLEKRLTKEDLKKFY